MNFRFRHKQLGGHTHINLYVSSQAGAEAQDYTHALAGTLVLDNEQWEELKTFIEVMDDTREMPFDPSFQFVEEK